jgi:hypothetical protein
LIMFATMYWMQQIEGNNPLRMDHSRAGKTFTSLRNNCCQKKTREQGEVIGKVAHIGDGLWR